MGRERRECSCNRCRSVEEIHAEIRQKKKRIIYDVIGIVVALTLAAVIGALLIWSMVEHAEHYEERTEERIDR